MLDGIYDAITGICKIFSSVFSIITETFEVIMSLLSDIPGYIESISMYYQLLPDNIQAIGYMMLSIIVIFTVLKIINYIVPGM